MATCMAKAVISTEAPVENRVKTARIAGRFAFWRGLPAAGLA